LHAETVEPIERATGVDSEDGAAPVPEVASANAATFCRSIVIPVTPLDERYVERIRAINSVKTSQSVERLSERRSNNPGTNHKNGAYRFRAMTRDHDTSSRSQVDSHFTLASRTNLRGLSSVVSFLTLLENPVASLISVGRSSCYKA